MNKKKKTMIIAVSAVLLVCVALGISLGLLLNRHSHTFSEEWSTDENYHWHSATCGHTEEIEDKGKHSFGTDGLCVCGKHRHKYSEVWSSDDADHWHICTVAGCVEITDKSEHEFVVNGDCVCGKHKHIFSTQWTTDGTHHWHAAACGDTEEVKDKNEHIFGVNGDCVCGEHRHVYSTQWTTDDTYHWHAATCGDTEEVKDKSEHSFGINGLCVCGSHKHSYTKTWSSDEKNHWHSCTLADCDSVTDKSEHSFGGDGDCVCGEHRHVFSTQWTTDETYHWYAATCRHTLQVKDKSEHSYGQDGYCVCGGHEHKYSEVWSSDEKNHWHECDVCGDRKDQTIHLYNGGKCLCGRFIPVTGTLSLDYQLNSDGLSYTCTGKGFSNTSDITIGSEHNGKPVTAIAASAFKSHLSSSGKLWKVTIPFSIKEIGNDAFAKNSALYSVEYIGDIAGWCGIKFGNANSNPLNTGDNSFKIGDKLVSSLVIPDGVTEIGQYAFYGCSSLTGVTIPDSVTIVGTGAFQNCNKLTTVNYTGTQEQWTDLNIGTGTGITSSMVTFNGKAQPAMLIRKKDD